MLESDSIDHVLSVHRYEFQMQFGSIGWSVGATLGYAQALKGKKRVIASIGDGSFQVTAQVILLNSFDTASRLKVAGIQFPTSLLMCLLAMGLKTGCIGLKTVCSWLQHS